MNNKFLSPRPITTLSFAFLFLTSALTAYSQQRTVYGLPSQRQVIDFLTHSLAWYRSGLNQQLSSNEPEYIQFVENSQAARVQILRSSFDYARAIAAVEQTDSAPSKFQDHSTNPASAGSDVQDFLKIKAQCDIEVQNARNEISSLQNTINARRGVRSGSLSVVLAESRNRFDLLHAECEDYSNLLGFVRTVDSGVPQKQGLSSIIDDLARTVPELENTGLATQQSIANSQAINPKSTGSSIPELISNVLGTRRRLEALDLETRSTDALAQFSQSLRTPLVQYLKSALQNANIVPGNLEGLRQQKMHLDAVSAQITALSPAILTLDNQKLLFSTYEMNIASWRGLVASQYASAWKMLILHLVLFAGMIGVLLAIARSLRRFTIRHLHHTNRGHTIFLAERILLWLCIFLVVVFSFVSNLGSLVTFLGLLTAGLAVALQNVILAVFGYVVLVSQLGLRPGDRVQISNTTGEIVELGLLEFQLREIDAEGKPSGKVVSFSTLLVFLAPATGIFKMEASKPISDVPQASVAIESADALRT